MLQINHKGTTHMHMVEKLKEYHNIEYLQRHRFAPEGYLISCEVGEMLPDMVVGNLKNCVVNMSNNQNLNT